MNSKNQPTPVIDQGSYTDEETTIQGSMPASTNDGTATTVPVVMSGGPKRSVFNRGWRIYTAGAFVVLFAGWGIYALLTSFAATPSVTKTWSTASDWNSGSLSNTVVSGSSVTLATTTTTGMVDTPDMALAAATTSPTDTVILNNAHASIIDGSGNAWTVRYGIVYITKSGKTTQSKAGYTANVTRLAYVNGVVWQENSSNLWWSWNGSGWSGGNGISKSPLPSTTTTTAPSPSPNETVVKNNAGGSLIDSNGTTWTVSGGVVSQAKAGGTAGDAGYSANVTEIAYVNGVVWQENSSNLWWSWNGSGWSGGNGISTSPLSGTSTSTPVPTTYATNGTVTLSFNAGTSVTWNALTDQATTPSGTSVATQVRTSANDSTWSAWTSNVSSAAASQYIQVQASLTTTNTASTPTLTSLTLTYTPPSATLPTVSISASATSVTSGQSATITWSATNATSCTASGAWSGSEATSGSVSTGALTANSTYSLSCTGAGGTANGSVAVAVAATSSNSGFITTSGTSLMLNGSPFKFIGFDFIPVGDCWSGTNMTTAQMDTFFSLLPKNSVARFTAPEDPTDSPAFVESVVAAADKYGQHVIITLNDTNSDNQCDPLDVNSTYGSGKTVAYYVDQAQPGSDYMNWVKSIVTPLANDPGVAVWEVANEPDHSGSTIYNGLTTAQLNTFLGNAATYVRSLDSHHLIGVAPADIGDMGGESNYETILKNMDIIDDHDYSWQNGQGEVDAEVPTLEAMSKALNKPWIMDEAGVPASLSGSGCTSSTPSWNSGSGLSTSARATFLMTKANDYFSDYGISGIDFWDYATTDSGCDYGMFSSDPLISQVQGYAIP